MDWKKIGGSTHISGKPDIWFQQKIQITLSDAEWEMYLLVVLWDGNKRNSNFLTKGCPCREYFKQLHDGEEYETIDRAFKLISEKRNTRIIVNWAK